MVSKCQRGPVGLYVIVDSNAEPDAETAEKFSHKLYLQNVNTEVNSARDLWLGDYTWKGLTGHDSWCDGLMQ